MLAFIFTFTCLTLLLFCDSVQSDRKSPFLITENIWPQDCVLDCQRGRHRAVCGNNGRMYKSMCAFQRAQCINTHLRLAPRVHCSDPSQSKCQQARAQALEANARRGSSHVSPSAAMFVPECHPEGHFLPVQCHNQTGYCWCSTPDGKPLSGTSVLHEIPSCTDHVAKFAEMPNKDEDGETEPTANPRKPPELTAPPIWVTILMNSVRKPTDSPQTCDRERASLLSQILSVWQDERFIPECTADGLYNPVQCHTATGYCWCVRVDNGRPLSGTSTRNRIPDCSGVEGDPGRPDRNLSGKPLPGCPGPRKEQFLQSLLRALQLEAKHSGSLNLYQVISNSSSSTPAASSSSLTLSVSPSMSVEAVESSNPQEVLQWHFGHLDVDSNGVLSEREARPLRQFLRRKLKPRRCAKKFAQYCDRDGDRGLTLEELRVCLGL